MANNGDIVAAIEAAKTGIEKVGKITVNLEAEGSYALSASIETAAGLVINGNGATIDASALEAPFILMSTTPTVLEKNGYYRVDEISVDSLTVTGLKNSIFYDNNTKYCVVDFAITNSTLALATTEVKNEALIAFQGGGAKDVTFVDNTIYGKGEIAKYFIRFNNSARLDRYGFSTSTETNNITYISNTFYKVIMSDGQWGNTTGLAQSYVKFDIEKNIWYDCSKDVIRRLAGGQAPKGSDNTFAYNTYFNNGENIGSSEANYDKSGTILETNPDFADAAAGNFTIGADTQQAEYQTGATKWLVEYVPAPDLTEAKAALLAEINAAKELLGNDTESDLGKELAAAITEAQDVYDNAVSNEQINEAIEALKAAEEAYKTTGINGVDADTTPVEYFNLQGVRVDNPSNGVYIRRQGSKISKVVL